MLKRFIISTFFIFSINSIWANDTLYLEWEGKFKKIRYPQWQTKYAKEKLQITVDNHPNYSKKISYEGVNFVELMSLLGRKITKNDVVIITCTDGYRPVLKGEYFVDGEAILAYKEVKPSIRVTNDKRWTKVKMENEYVYPGPYYMIWRSRKGHSHSWPYQIQKIEIKKKKDFVEFSKIKPKSKEAMIGFSVFKSKCIKCHSIKYVGPKGKAPDLANVMGYRTKRFVRDRIRKGKGKMPPFSKVMISDSDIEEIIKYFEEIYNHH